MLQYVAFDPSSLCLSQDILNLTSKQNEAASSIASGSVHPLRKDSSSKFGRKAAEESGKGINGGSVAKPKRGTPSSKGNVDSTCDLPKSTKMPSQRKQESLEVCSVTAISSTVPKTKNVQAVSVPEKRMQRGMNARATHEIVDIVAQIEGIDDGYIISSTKRNQRIKLESPSAKSTGLSIDAQDTSAFLTKAGSLPEKTTQCAPKAKITRTVAEKVLAESDYSGKRPRTKRSRCEKVNEDIAEVEAPREAQYGTTSKILATSKLVRTTIKIGIAKATRNGGDEFFQEIAHSNISKESSVHCDLRINQEEVEMDSAATLEAKQSVISKTRVASLPKTKTQRGPKPKTTSVVKEATAIEEVYDDHKVMSIVKRKRCENQDKFVSESSSPSVSKVAKLRATSKRNRCDASTATNIASDSVPALETLEESTAAADILLSLTKSCDRTDESNVEPVADYAEVGDKFVDPATDKETDSFESTTDGTHREVSAASLPLYGASKLWYYIDFHHRVQGPFETVLMQNWHRLGHFKDCPNLLVKSEGMVCFVPMSTSELRHVFNPHCE